MSLNTGQMLQQRYRIVTLLGQGGMGAVYRAWDTRLNIPVAVKELVPQPGLAAPMLNRLRQQFIQEAQTLARLDHPHLVNVSDYFEEEGKSYLVMKYVEGESLAERIKRPGALDETQVLTWARQLLAALAYYHKQGVLHRDIKPQNVIITPDGEAVLVDFGLVKLWDPNDPRTRTAIRGAGTPEYAPPEQYSTHTGHTEPRSDIYSLGATLYHALAGQAPPSVTDRMAFPERFKTPRELDERVSAQIDQVIQRAMALPQGARWSTAEEMAKALDAETEAALAPPKRRPALWRWGVGIVALIGVLALVVISLEDGGRPKATYVTSATATATPESTTSQSIATETVAPTRTVEQQPAPSPKPTITRSPTSTPRPVLTYEALAIQSIANTSWDHFQSPPLGDVTLGEIPFNLSSQIFKSQAEPAPNNAYPTKATLNLQVAQAQRIYLLLTAGNAFARYNRLSVGEVRVMCEDSEHLLTTLELGRNLREWHTIGDVVTTAPEAKMVWRGALADFPNLTGHIDMLTLSLPETCRQGVLSEVRIEDLSTENVGSRDPALNVIGLTVAYYP